tara:strand:- start:1746 stop:2750 length:1005 start_codon:yes stop_codon:yes gene_type:complete
MNELKTEFQKYFQKPILDVNQIDHKGNNQLYKILLDQKTLLLKKYSDVTVADHWNRGKTEFEFLSYFWEKGFRNIPQPIKLFNKENIGIYSYESGRILSQEEAKEKDIKQLGISLARFHRIDSKGKQQFPAARESSLSLQDYLTLLNNRADRLRNSKVYESGKDFLYQEVFPTLDQLKNSFSKKTKNFNLDQKLDIKDQVLTPGDFGFHNVLVDNNKYTFLDFEYAGRNDPVQQISHFIHQPTSRNIRKDLKDLFLENYHEKANCSKEFDKRFELVEPLVMTWWVFNQLNVLLPDYMKHLKFSHDSKDEEYFEKLTNNRLEIAKEKLNQVKNKF